MNTDLDGKRLQSDYAAPYLEDTLGFQPLWLALEDLDRVQSSHDQMFHALLFSQTALERVGYGRRWMHRADDLHIVVDLALTLEDLSPFVRNQI